MKKNQLKSSALDTISLQTREIFQDLLKARIKSKADIEALAQALGKTTSLVKKMLYRGDGGLDAWSKALAYTYEIDGDDLKRLQQELSTKKRISYADQLWFSLKNELAADEDEMAYLAMIAKEAIRIKREVQKSKVSKKRLKG